MNSAVGRLRRAFLWSLLSFGFFAALSVRAQEAAGPAKITVSVQPANATAQKATCDAATYECKVPVTIQTAGKTETLTVHILYVPGGALFNFETPEGYLYAGAKTQADPQHPEYTTMWHTTVGATGASVSDITLYGPAAKTPIEMSFIDKPGGAVADLTLSLEAAP